VLLITVCLAVWKEDGDETVEFKVCCGVVWVECVWIVEVMKKGAQAALLSHS
jgi:hypothetical protein